MRCFHKLKRVLVWEVLQNSGIYFVGFNVLLNARADITAKR